jgi:hypothetical protein
MYVCRIAKLFVLVELLKLKTIGANASQAILLVVLTSSEYYTCLHLQSSFHLGIFPRETSGEVCECEKQKVDKNKLQKNRLSAESLHSRVA